MVVKLNGFSTALITPMMPEGNLDIEAFQKLCQWQIDQGISGLVPVGTTGESPTLSDQEHRQLIDSCVAVAKGQVPVIAGTGSNNTEEAIHYTRHAEESGADAALIVTPYYNKPTQEGLYHHYHSIASRVSLPIIIYNIPGRSIVDMSIETMHRLYQDCPNIIGVKDATADLSRPLQTRVRLGAEFIQLSGEDMTVAAFFAQGGHGCISVTSNIVPQLCTQLYTAWQNGDLEGFTVLRDRLVPLHAALSCETSPGPVKYAASRLGFCHENGRLPLVQISAESKKIIDSALDQLNLL